MNKKHQKKQQKKTLKKYFLLINDKKYNQALTLFKSDFPNLEDFKSPLDISRVKKENPQLVNWLPEKNNLTEFEYFLGSFFNIKKDKKTAFILAFLLSEKFSDDFSVNAGFGLFCIQLELLDLAENYLRKAEKLNPNDSKNLVNFGNVLMKKSNIEEAHYLYKKAFQLDPNNLVALTNLAMSYLYLGDKPNYEKYITKTLVMSPSNVSALVSYGQYQLFEIKDKKGFKQTIAKIEAINKNSPYIHWFKYLLKNSENKDGSDDLETFVKKAQTQGTPHPITSVRVTNDEEGMFFYNKALDKIWGNKLFPKWKYSYEKGLISLQKWEIDNAKKYLLESLSEYSNNPDAKINLISIYIIEDDLVNANKLIESLKDFVDYSLRLKCFIALISIKESKNELAKTILSEVLGIDSDYFPANYLMGQLFFIEKDYLQSKCFLSKIIPVKDPQINYLFGRVLLKLGETTEAINYLNLFLQYILKSKINFTDLISSVYFNLGHAFLKIDKIKMAIKFFKKSLKSRINYFCLNDIAIAFIKRKSFSKGNRFLNKSLRIKSDYKIALHNKNELKPILSIQIKYYLSLIILTIAALLSTILEKDNYALFLSVGVLIVIIQKKLKAGLSFSFGEYKFGFSLGEYDFNIDEKLSSWILSVRNE